MRDHQIREMKREIVKQEFINQNCHLSRKTLCYKTR